jgi:hypothetical protein
MEGRCNAHPNPVHRQDPFRRTFTAEAEAHLCNWYSYQPEVDAQYWRRTLCIVPPVQSSIRLLLQATAKRTRFNASPLTRSQSTIDIHEDTSSHTSKCLQRLYILDTVCVTPQLHLRQAALDEVSPPSGIKACSTAVTPPPWSSDTSTMLLSGLSPTRHTD